MKRSREEIQLTQAEAKRQCLDKEIAALRRLTSQQKREERQARSIEVPWELFREAAEECREAWKHVYLADEDREGACEGCDYSDDELMEYQKGERRYYELHPLSGCPTLTVCAWCLNWGPENALEAVENEKRHKSVVRVDPEDYDEEWKAKLMEGAVVKK